MVDFVLDHNFFNSFIKLMAERLRSLKRAGGRGRRGQGSEATRLATVGRGAFHCLWPDSCRGTGKRLIEDW